MPFRRIPTLFLVLGFLICHAVSAGIFAVVFLRKDLFLTPGGSPVLFAFGLAWGVFGASFLWSFLHDVWGTLQPYGARMTPGRSVGFLFIPFYNIIHLWHALVGLTEDGNRALEATGIAGPRFSRGLAIATFVLILLSAVPFLGLASLVMMAVFMGTSGRVANLLPPDRIPIGRRPPIIAYRWHLAAVWFLLLVVLGTGFDAVVARIRLEFPLTLAPLTLMALLQSGALLAYARPFGSTETLVRIGWHFLCSAALWCAIVWGYTLLFSDQLGWSHTVRQTAQYLIAILGPLLFSLVSRITLRIPFGLRFGGMLAGAFFGWAAFDTLHRLGVEMGWPIVETTGIGDGQTITGLKASASQAIQIGGALVAWATTIPALYHGGRRARWDSWKAAETARAATA